MCHDEYSFRRRHVAFGAPDPTHIEDGRESAPGAGTSPQTGKARNAEVQSDQSGGEGEEMDGEHEHRKGARASDKKCNEGGQKDLDGDVGQWGSLPQE